MILPYRVTRLLIAWDCFRGLHTARVADDGVIRCKFCGEDQSW